MPPAERRRRLSQESSAFYHAGGAKGASRQRLAEPHTAGTEQTWNTQVVMFSSESYETTSAAAAAVLASVPDVEDGYPPAWCMLTTTPSRLFLTTSAPTVPFRTPGTMVNDVHLQFITHTDIWREGFGRGTIAIWQRTVGGPGAFLSGFRPLFFRSNFAALTARESVDRFTWVSHGGGSSPQT